MDVFLKLFAGSLKYFQKLLKLSLSYGLIRGTAVASLGLGKVITLNNIKVTTLKAL